MAKYTDERKAHLLKLQGEQDLRQAALKLQNDQSRQKLLAKLKEQRLLKKQKEERNNTQNKLDKLEISELISGADKKLVESMLRDRRTAEQSDFEHKEQKSAGVSTGYIATEKTTTETFILKHFHKSAQSTKTETQKVDRLDARDELIGSTMYQLLLYNRAPKITLVIAEKEPDSLYIRSKFFKNADTLAKFSGWDAQGGLIDSTKKLKNLDGFEKVIVASHILGEVDYHAENLMVQNNIVVKIDHGKSFREEIYSNFASMVSSTHKTFGDIQYSKAIADGNLSFNIKKYSDSLNQMLLQFNEQQMENVIDQKFDELKKVGYDPKNSTIFSEGQWTCVDTFDELKKSYKDQMKQRIDGMKEVAKSAAIVAKFTNAPLGFMNGQWLEAFATSPFKDPVAYAAHHNINIEGKNALEWAHDNKYQIKNEGKEIDPVEYIQTIATKNKLPLSKSVHEFIAQTPQRYTLDNKELVRNQPFVKKAQALDEADAKKLISLVDGFIEKEVVTGKVTEEKVAEFYSKLLDNFVTNGYLSRQDVNSRKFSQEYHQQITDTIKLLNLPITATDQFVRQSSDNWVSTSGDGKGIESNTDEPTTAKLDGADKVYYKVASFCKAIGLEAVSNYFTKKINSEKLGNLHALEKALSIGITLSKISPNSKKTTLAQERLEKVGKSAQATLRARQGKQGNSGVER